MPMQITMWHRKDVADRNDLAFAALQVCRVLRGQDDVENSRLFWQGWNDIAIVTEGEPSMRSQESGPEPAMAKATRELADLADPVQQFWLGEAKRAFSAYEAAESAT